ncbi:MAG: hypothetical protein KatS3mg094_284 [Candidatus Parcubacteria bacterium]|nr:MAG: hypothetical protein KatS3mg094_284 [Candidatus Parcubacteria bacterium]
MQEIINILNNILRIIQVIIILGSIGIFIYLGLLFYFKKFDEVKKNLPYVILGLILLISVYSLPVIILSFLEKENVADNISFSNNSNNIINSTTTSSTSATFFCELIGDDALVSDVAGTIIDSSSISITTSSSGCNLSFNIDTRPLQAYVFCTYKPLPMLVDQDCWGIYGSSYLRNGIEIYNVIYSNLTEFPNIKGETKKIARYPSQAKSVFCTETSAKIEINNLIREEGNYLIFVFSAMPTSSRPLDISNCRTISTVINENRWLRTGWHILAIKAEKR